MSVFYSGVALEHGKGRLINFVASSQIAESTLMKFLHVSDSRFIDTFKSASRLQLDVLYLQALFAFVSDSVKTVGVHNIVDGICYEIDRLLMA